MPTCAYGDEAFQNKLFCILEADDKQKFVDLIKTEGVLPCFYNEILICCFEFYARECSVALLKGELGYKPYVASYGKSLSGLQCWTPLFDAVGSAPLCVPEVLEPLIKDCGGDKLTDVIVDGHLPLHMVLARLRYDKCLSTWSPEQSLIKLIILLCMPDVKQVLDCARLVAEHTTLVHNVALGFCHHNELLELAGLLLVAHENVTSSGGTANKCILNELLSPLLHGEPLKHTAHGAALVRIFEKAGDALNAYVKSLQEDVYPKDVIVEVAELLMKSGLHLVGKDVEGLGDVCSIQPQEMISIKKRLGFELDGTLKEAPKGFVFPALYQQRPLSGRTYSVAHQGLATQRLEASLALVIC